MFLKKMILKKVGRRQKNIKNHLVGIELMSDFMHMQLEPKFHELAHIF